MTLAGGRLALPALFVLAMVVLGVAETAVAPDELRGRYNGLFTLAWTAALSQARS